MTEIRQQIAALEENEQKDQRRRTELVSLLEQEELKLTKHTEAQSRFVEIGETATTGQVLQLFGGYVAEALDKTKGKDVTDQSIFRAHAAKYEVRSSFRCPDDSRPISGRISGRYEGVRLSIARCIYKSERVHE